MNAEIYAEWLRGQGGRVLRTASAYWHTGEYGVYQAFPYHWLIQPSDEEISELFFRHRAVAVRYFAPTDASVGLSSYHTVYDRPTYDLGDLGAWARKNVRRGLKNCAVERISFQRLIDEGWALRGDTLSRQGRAVPMSHAAWRRRYLAAADYEGFEVWGALVRGALGAFLVTFQMDEVCFFLYQQCDRNYLREHVNNALTFVVTQTIIGRAGVRTIFYGAHSLDAPPSVDEFKFRMGFRAKPVRQRVVFHPYLSLLVNPVSYQIVKRMASWRPGNRQLSKAEGMLRVCLAGGNPINAESASRSETIA